MRRRNAAWLTLFALVTFGCERSRSDSVTGPAPEPRASAAPARAPEPVTDSVDLIERLPACDVKQRGILLDLGSASVDPAREYAVGPFDDVENEERAGSTYANVRTRRLAYDFWLDEPAHDVVVSFRASGHAARKASVYLDNHRLGTVTLPVEDMGVRASPAFSELSAGRHTVILRFVGTPKTVEEPYAVLDWLRIGVKEDAPERYSAPTLDRLVTDVVLDDVPKRALVLRGPSTVRCSMVVVPGSELRLSLGYWGAGRGVAQIRVLEDGEAPVVLTERRVSGGHGRAWTPLKFSLDAFQNRLVGLEIRALETTSGGRVAFGEPEVAVTYTAPDKTPNATVAVIVVASGLDRRLVPPWGPVGKMAAIGELGRSVAFDSYRAPTTVVSGVLASLFSGLPSKDHQLEDPLARLPNGLPVLAERVKEASGRAAFFTGVPASFAAFGFDRGWTEYETFSPVHDVAATAPIHKATQWLRREMAEDRERKTLVVVHVRGGHPPWDLTHDEAAALPPEDYSGRLEPRGGAVTLAKIRSSRHPSQQRLTADEWERLKALELAALGKQSAALEQLLKVVDESGVPSLVAFMGDVGTGDAPHLPFAPAPALTEDHLLVPMIVRFPRNALAGTRVKTTVSATDLTRTVLAALGVDASEARRSLDLFRVAGGFRPAGGRSHTATVGSAFSTRWGPWLMRGEVRRVPRLCQMEIDPACANDVLEQNPIAAAALWRESYRAIVGEPGEEPVAHERESAAPEPDTQAALKVFGYGN